MDSFWDSWCGQTTVDGPIAASHFTHLFNIPLPADEDCIVNFLSAIPHMFFLLASSSILLYYHCCRTQSGTDLTQKLPSHYFRWILLIVFLVICVFSIAEGILTDFTYQTISTTQPHLYVPQCFALLAVISSLVYFQHCEVWQSPKLSWITLIYWILAFIVEIGKLIAFSDVTSSDETNLISILRFDIFLISTLVYLIMIVLEITVVCSQVPSYLALNEPDMYYYEDYANPLSLAKFSWVSWLLKEGHANALEMKNLGSLPQRHTTRYNYEQLKKNLTKELDDAVKAERLPSLWKIYAITYHYPVIMTFMQKLVSSMSIIIQPIALFGIVSYVEQREQGLLSETLPHYVTFTEFFADVYVLAILYVLEYILSACMLPYTLYQLSVIGVHARSAMQALVYEKSLRLSNLAGSGATIGEITNHMSTDANSLLLFAQRGMVEVPIFTIRLTIVLGYLWHFVGGVITILCVVIVLIALPLFGINVKKSSKYQAEALAHSDIRLKRANDMLNGIKLLKLYGWEDIFINLMNSARYKELQSIWNVNVQFGLRSILSVVIPTFVFIVIFDCYPYLLGEDLTPSVTFTVVILANLVFFQIIEISMGLSHLISSLVATRRLAKFFLMPEIDGNDASSDQGYGNTTSDGSLRSADTTGKSPKWFSSLQDRRQAASDECDEKLPLTMTSYGTYTSGGIENYIHDPDEKKTADDAIIRISGGSFAWDRESDAPTLTNINVQIPKGKLVMIVGPVAGGKSSLLSAILGEMRMLRGSVEVNEQMQKESVAYTAQRAWIINDTVRENIMFGKPYDYYKYQRVIEACALQPDLDMLPAGDMTEIGEKGINLSGGQKQRVSVARAMYSDKEIVLMDDPLSALDVHVGDHVFKNCIKAMLSKGNRTVILVTHQLQHLQDADLILVMRDGELVAQGHYDIISKYSDLFGALNTSEDDKSDTDDISQYGDDDDDETHGAVKQRMRTKSISSQGSRLSHVSRDGTQSVDSRISRGQLMEAEEIKRGSVSYQVYLYYLKSMGLPIILASITFLMLEQVANTGNRFWLGAWAEAGLNITGADVDTEFYVLWFTVISIGRLGCASLGAMSAVMSFYLAAKHIHKDMVQNIFGSPIRFFDTTPVGRILNRLSYDTLAIDTILPQRSYYFSAVLLAGIAGIFAIGIVVPIFIFEIIPCIVIFGYLQNYFLTSSRELQRLESTTRSPVYAHFSETLGGLPTIRAYGERERFFNVLLEKIDINKTAFLYLHASTSWVLAHVYMLCSVVILMTSFTTVVAVELTDLSSSYVGIALSYGALVVFILKGVLTTSSDVEIQMNAVERVRHYTQLDNEDFSGIEPSSNWPSRGGIEIDDISVRYADNLPPVLKGVSLYIRPGEKVGICGRTGSGKSSLTLTFFRLIDTFKGRILIDGEDIATLPLKTVRQRLSIIPQDPILFTGSIRYNLDPGGTKTDLELWKALETAQLKTTVSKLQNGLDYEVEEGGENFSVGQRQLFCVARAFLRNSKILVMDEATASVDYNTEKILQKITDSVFSDKTVITIAHRISTIMNSDTIVVLSDGEIVEHDTPEVLLSRDSVFASLVQANK